MIMSLEIWWKDLMCHQGTEQRQGNVLTLNIEVLEKGCKLKIFMRHNKKKFLVQNTIKNFAILSPVHPMRTCVKMTCIMPILG